MAETAVSAVAVTIGAEPHANLSYTTFATGVDTTCTNANEWYDVVNGATLRPGSEGFSFVVATGKLTALYDIGNCEIDVRAAINSTDDSTSTISLGLRKNASLSTTEPETGCLASTLNTAAAGVTPPASVRHIGFKTELQNVRSGDFFTISVRSTDAGDVVKARQYWLSVRQIPAIKGTRA